MAGMSDFATIFAALARHQVRYVLVGTLGAIAHGARLTTADADICIDIAADNLRHVAALLKELGARSAHHPQQEIDFDDLPALQLDNPTRHHLFTTPFGEIDILPEPLGFDYPQLAPRAVVKPGFGLAIPVAALDDIIASKLSARRDKDLAATPELRRLQADLAQGIAYNGLAQD